MKREDYLSWDEYFMGIAVLSSMRSKDPSTQVGACIVNEDKRILSMGYNGMPRCCSDDEYPWDKNDNALDSKYLYVCHAEFNAILNTRFGSALKDCKLYVTLFPCNECAKAIIQTGIKEIIYLDNKHKNEVSVRASEKLLNLAGIKITHYEGKVPEINFN